MQRSTLGLLSGMVLLTGAAAAGAQTVPAGGATADAGVSPMPTGAEQTSPAAPVQPPPPEPAPEQVQPSQPVAQPGPAAPVTSANGSITDTSGPTDHSVVVHRLGLRYFGADPGGSTTAGFQLHTVGLRYWMSHRVALEGGLGLLIDGMTGGAFGAPATVGFGVHFGVPIMLSEAKHLAIHVIPFAESAFVTGRGTDRGSVRVGGNLAAELQFGFIGIPQLSLQAQFGMSIVANSAGVRMGTTLGPGYSVLDILGASLSATYYFGS